MLGVLQASEIRDALQADADSGSLRRVDLSPTVHREAEHLLCQIDSAALRALEALHIAVTLLNAATHVVTFDTRMRTAALQAGLRTLEFGGLR
jgi:predicted nucleic acid-binding protein